MAVSTIDSNSLNATSDLTINGVTVGKGGGGLSQNTVVGNGALAATNTGNRNTAIGANAGAANTSGHITAVGAYALNSNTTGNSNVAVGGNDESTGAALQFNTTGSSNTAVGVGSLFNNTTASQNTAVGYQAAYNATVAGTTAIGYQALYTQGSPAGNTAVGYQAGKSQSTNGQCTYVGYNAGVNATAGNDTAVGYQALYTGASGGANTAIGSQALTAMTSGQSNTALGYSAGNGITSGQNNVVIGYSASNFGATLTTGSQNVYIGTNAGPSSASVTYEMCIATLNSQGKGSTTGFINPNGGGVYQGNNSGSWSQVSDQRLKKNIVDNTNGLEKISQLRVRNFEYRLPEEITELDPSCAIPNKGVQLGVIAQEIQEVFPDCVKTESTGVISVDSDNLTWYMINAIKDLKAIVDAQAAEIAELKAKVA